MLADVPARDKRVYVLIGNEPFEECMDRILQMIAWGCEPHAQPIMKLKALRKRPWVRYDWNTQLLIDVARWANRKVWRETPFSSYARGVKTRRRGLPGHKPYQSTAGPSGGPALKARQGGVIK